MHLHEHRRRRIRRAAVIIVSSFVSLLIAAHLIASPAANRPAMPAPPAVEARDEPGIMLTIESLAVNSVKLAFPDARVARLFSLYVPAGSPASPFVEPGP